MGMTMITRKRLGEIADNMYAIIGAWEHGDVAPYDALVAELRAASVEPSTKLLAGMVAARELDDRYIGYQVGVNFGNTAETYEVLTIASVEPIERTDAGRAGVRLTFAEYPGHHYDALGGISVQAPISVRRTSFVPAANYATGGARMADAIEALESKLSAIELALDAHRAALVAAGWLDVNGEPR